MVQVAELVVSMNLVWVLMTGFLVMFMQAGFACVETGFTRIKNATHTMMMNFMIYGIGIIGFFLAGFALMMGGAGDFAGLGGTAALNSEFTITLFGKPFGLFGTTGFGLAGFSAAGIFALFLFQMVFMDTAATIPTGAMAERWTFKSFVIYGFFISMIIYPIFGNWVWGGGWLSQLGTNFGLGNGFMDFAGSSVVHMVGGLVGLAGAIVLGPRIGKFKEDGTPIAIPGHSIPLAFLGTFILAFGWFGFNAGSTLAAVDSRIALVAANTMIASATGAFFAMLYTWWKNGFPDAGMCANGLLAGLVAITAPVAFVSPMAAFIIGAIAGVLVVLSVWFFEWKLKVDDPIGAVSVHGVCGLWGVLAVGIFANGTYGGVTGILYGGGAGQLIAQIIGGITVIIWAFGLSYVFFKVLDKFVPLRVHPDDEVAGLDRAEMGRVLAYPRDLM